MILLSKTLYVEGHCIRSSESQIREGEGGGRSEGSCEAVGDDCCGRLERPDANDDVEAGETGSSQWCSETENVGRGYGIAWNDNRTGPMQPWFARLDDDGNLIDPPGEVQLAVTEDDVPTTTSLAWTGEEFFFVWTNVDFNIGLFGKLIGTRISESGEVLEEKVILGTGQNNAPSVAWNGESFGLAFVQNNQYPFGISDVEYLGVECNCSTDADGDDILPCTGGDCDDSDPEVGFGLAEVCLDDKDNDCDGRVDCNDPDCVETGNAPSAISGVGFASDKRTLSWLADPQASEYDVARGVLSDVVAMENFRWTECAASRIPATSWSDDEDPPAGEAFYYVVRGRAQTCLLGTWGTPLRDDTLRECP